MTKTVGLVVKPHAAAAQAALAKVIAAGAGARFLGEEIEGVSYPTGVDVVASDVLSRESDLVVVLGGDGTLIRAASLLQQKPTPILGINLGHIGFLTELQIDEIDECVPRAIAGDLAVDDRMRLEAKLVTNGKVVLSQQILNDAVLSISALARIATYRIHHNGELVTTVRADGIIICTPTGSTAYSMAAGGPILAPGVEAVVVTPTAPQGLSHRPLVVNPDGALTVTLDSESSVYATLDGQVGREFTSVDSLVLTRAPVPTRFFRFGRRSYFHTLRAKLGWGEAVGIKEHPSSGRTGPR